ncbi:MAG: hypothetical protein AAFR38_12520 [Planctomycetota bacterium]
MRITRALTLGLSLAMVLGAGGCGGPRSIDYARVYPPAMPQSETLDVQVYRSGTHIELTNTTARSFGPSTLWINQRFSYPIEGFAPGESLRISLKEFIDEFGDPFRAGGFFATRQPNLVVLTQIETGPEDGGQMLGFITVGNRID